MKIRLDYVTNSSSSSYVTLNVKSKCVADLMKRYEGAFEQGLWRYLKITDDSIAFKEDDTFSPCIPNGEYTTFADCLCDFQLCIGDSYGEDYDLIGEMRNEMNAKKEEVNESILEFYLEHVDETWGSEGGEFGEEYCDGISRDVTEVRFDGKTLVKKQTGDSDFRTIWTKGK